MRIRGLETLRKWMSQDSRVIELIWGSEMILQSVSILRKKRECKREEWDIGDIVRSCGRRRMERKL